MDEWGEWGDECEGEATLSSVSELAPDAREAAKELVISMSGSEETNAKDDCVETVEVVEVVRTRADSSEEEGSRIHSE